MMRVHGGVPVTPRYSLLRDLLAIVIIALACPLAVLAQWTVGCLGQGFGASCALDAMFVSPVLLLGAGVLAGLSTRGWTGLLLVWIGGGAGMASILVMAGALGRSIPIDPISAVIATFWFMGPASAGYGVGRIVSHLRERRDRDRRREI
jgi:hypothetical protein